MDGATVKTDNSLEITLRFKDGTIILVKGENIKNKTLWVNAFQSQIDIFANKSLRATQPITAEDKALTIGNLGEKEEGDGAGVRKVIIPSVALKRALTSTNVNVSGPGDDNGHLASSFENYGSTNAVISVRADSNMKSPGSGGAKLMTIDGVDQNISHSNPMHPRL